MKKSSESELRASASYRARNRDKARLPGVMLSTEEAELLEKLSKIYGSKKAAIIAALTLLDKSMDEKN